MNLIITAKGELESSISVSQSSVSVSASEASKTLSYSINLPSSLEPGLHTGEIYVLEVPSISSLNMAQALSLKLKLKSHHTFILRSCVKNLALVLLLMIESHWKMQ